MLEGQSHDCIQLATYTLYTYLPSCAIIMFFDVLGLQQIKFLTRQSIAEKPFCLAVGKEWSLRQSTFKLEDTFTELHFQMKYRKPSWIEKKPLENIFSLFDNNNLKRLLIEGMFEIKIGHKLHKKGLSSTTKLACLRKIYTIFAYISGKFKVASKGKQIYI